MISYYNYTCCISLSKRDILALSDNYFNPYSPLSNPYSPL